MDKMAMETKNKTLERLEQLKALLPEVITETKDANGDIVSAIDAKKLEQLLSTKVIEGDESYDFTWVGKKQAMVEASRPIRKTLRPCKEESVDWDKTENLYIEGDNLDVLKLLQESYLNKIKMIYIDPPYNTGNDFIYNDNFTMDKDEYEEGIGLKDEEGNKQFTQNNDSNPRFHSDWCSMIYPRLKLARNLLSEDGVIFISIDDNEVGNMRKICDEVFGEINFVAQFSWKKKQGGGNDSNFVVVEHEYILCYAKDIQHLNFGLDKNYKLDDALYPYKDDKGEYGLITLDKASIQFSKSLVYEIVDKDGNKYMPRIVKGKQSCWRWSKEKVKKQFDELVFKNDKVYTKYYRPDGVTPKSLLVDSIYGRTESGNDDIKSLFEQNPFSYPKPVALLKHFVSICSQTNNFSILDFFSGSATTAHAVMQLNADDGGKRKFIMVQLPEVCDEKSEAYKAGYKNICEIGKERIRRAGKKIKQETGKTDLDIGFRVLKLDESNMKNVYFTPEEYKQTDLVDMVSNIKEDRTPEDLLYACMLEWGLELSLPHETKAINGYNIHIVNEGDLIACFDDKVSEDVIKQIADMKPLRVVFRDSSFATDSARINVDEIFKLKSPNTKIKVL